MTREGRSIELLKICEPKNGYHLAFSGGKDSQVLYSLAEKAEVKFKAYFCRTSVDPPEIIDFVKKNYPAVTLLRPKRTMYQLILDKKVLPTRQIRFCCFYLKEYAGNGEVTLTGIRSQESPRRALRPVIDYNKKQRKITLHPIKDWSEAQVWKYLKKEGLEACKLYYLGFDRIGCIGCPMTTRAIKEFEFMRYPQHQKAYLNTIDKLRALGYYLNFKDSWDVFQWWLSNDSVVKYRKKNKNVTVCYR